MPTSEALLTKMNECIETLQDAEQTVVNARELIVNAPALANEAKAAAGTAQATANAALSTANECAGIILRKTEKGDDIAAVHNCYYRGKNLTNVYTLAQLSAKIQQGDFSDLFIGDYITRPFTHDGKTTNINWRFGHFNYWKYMGDTSLAQNHILMVPDVALYSSKMQETNTTEGGVPASIVFQALQDGVYNEVNASTCMDGHVLAFRDFISGSVNATADSGAGGNLVGTTIFNSASWRDVKLGMFHEPMVYGGRVFSSSGEDVRCGKSQIALFRLDPTWINGRSARYGWWLGAVASSAHFCTADGHGYALCGSASDSLGVRPFFLFS